LEFLQLSGGETMTLYDDEGREIARIHTDFEHQITKEELERRTACQGDTCTTAQLLDELKRLVHPRDVNFRQEDRFLVKWLPDARAELITILGLNIPSKQDPDEDRHRAALSKFFLTAILEIDPKLRAWVSLAGGHRHEAYVLKSLGDSRLGGCLDVVFKVADGSIQVVKVLPSPNDHKPAQAR
jgi:hypothetical protein